MGHLAVYLSLFAASLFLLHHTYSTTTRFTKVITVTDKKVHYLQDGYYGHDEYFFVIDSLNNSYHTSYFNWIDMQINKSYNTSGYSFFGFDNTIYTYSLIEK